MAVVLELCGELGVPYEVRRGSVEELRAADEVLLPAASAGWRRSSSSTAARSGPATVTRRLRDAFEARVGGSPVR